MQALKEKSQPCYCPAEDPEGHGTVLPGSMYPLMQYGSKVMGATNHFLAASEACYTKELPVTTNVDSTWLGDSRL